VFGHFEGMLDFLDMREDDAPKFVKSIYRKVPPETVRTLFKVVAGLVTRKGGQFALGIAPVL
jgi:hypothetical protein